MSNNKKQKNPKRVRRDRVKHAALKKPYTTRVRQEYLDYDYLDQLNEEELTWLNQFTEEYLNGSFKKDGTDIQEYEKYGKDANDRNNARNRCIYGALKNKDNKFQNKKLVNYDNLSNDIENELSKDINPSTIENAYIDYLDYKEVEEMMLQYDEAMKDFNEVSENLQSFQQLSQELPEPLVTVSQPESENEPSQHVLLPVSCSQ